MQTIPRELDFRREVLPVVAVGLLLNLLGREFAATHLHFTALSPDMPDFLFLDLIGTALAALLLGPWWAALVGVLASGVDGIFYTAYFPFGTTSIVVGLVWGYLARGRRMQRALEWGTSLAAIRDGVYAYLVLVVAGAVTCDLVSALTKVLLYTKMGLPLDLGKHYYLVALSAARNWHLPHPALTSLLAADLLRELADKSLTVAVAVSFAAMIGFIPGAREREGLRKRARGTWDAWKTDAHSILAFTLVYAVFLFMARLGRPELRYPDARQGVAWLQDPTVLLLLYLPMLLAAAAFVTLSLDAGSHFGQAVDADRRVRASLYRRLMPHGASGAREIEHREWFRMLRQESVYGLLVSAAVWPARLHWSGAVLPVVLYFGLVVAFAVVFFDERRNFSRRWNQARRWMDTLHGWRQLHPAATPERMLHAFGELLGKDRLRVSSHPVQRGSLIWQSAIPLLPLPGLPSSESAGRNCLLLAVAAGDGALDAESCAHLDAAMEACGAATALVLTTTPEIVEPRFAAWLRSAYQNGREVLLLGWENAEAALLDTTRKEGAGAEWLRWRLRLIDAVADSGAEARPETPDALARRALPCLRYLLEALPPNSRVADLGAGRGRHTFAAAEEGHRVLWIERRQELELEMRTLLEHYAAAERIRLWRGDYCDLSQDELDGTDLVILTGVLQHLQSREEFEHQMGRLHVALGPGGAVFIEMLFDMRFDGVPASDGRFAWKRDEFESALAERFAAPAWRIERLRGPYQRCQDFAGGSRSFVAPARRIDCTSLEYLVTHCG